MNNLLRVSFIHTGKARAKCAVERGSFHAFPHAERGAQTFSLNERGA
jgi:hypothetical protein